MGARTPQTRMPPTHHGDTHGCERTWPPGNMQGVPGWGGTTLHWDGEGGTRAQSASAGPGSTLNSEQDNTETATQAR